MSLHPLAAEFAHVADVYEQGRAEYPRAASGAIAAELGLSAGNRVLDLAAGTGKFSRCLLAAGLDVVAVEPLEALRDKLAASIGGERVHAGVAEEIPLDDSSVPAVTVADAFHWFDATRALAEIRRVLTSEGALAVVTTAPDWRGAAWGQALAEFMVGTRPAHPNFEGATLAEKLVAAGGWSPVRAFRVISDQPAAPEQVVALVASMSWVAALAEPQRSQLVDEARAIVAGAPTPETLPLVVNVEITRPIPGHP